MTAYFVAFIVMVVLILSIPPFVHLRRSLGDVIQASTSYLDYSDCLRALLKED